MGVRLSNLANLGNSLSFLEGVHGALSTALGSLSSVSCDRAYGSGFLFNSRQHLTQLELAAVLGGSTRPYFSNAYVDLIARKGAEHERNFLEALRADGHEVAEVGLGDDRRFAAAAETTAAAMRGGAKYIYQAVFLSDDWHGIADFLERIDRPSALGEWSYQVLDTKLARHPRPEHALQLCFYSYALGQIQGIAPEMAYVVLGTRERFPIRMANVSAYFRRLQNRFREAILARSQTAPYPCDHCGGTFRGMRMG